LTDSELAQFLADYKIEIYDMLYLRLEDQKFEIGKAQ
jgi:hypothetical protein